MALIDNLIAYYKLDGNSNDSVASNDGTDTDVSYVAGKINQATDFNGSSSKIDVSTTGLPSGNTSRTMLAWVKPNSFPNWAVIFGYGTSASFQGFTFQLYGITGRLTAQRYGGGGSSGSDTGLQSGVWQQIAVVYDGLNEEVTYYYNGQEDGTESLADVNTVLDNGRIGKSIPGWDGADGTYVWDGSIDELGVWDRALSGEEILELYNSGAGLSYPFSSEGNDGAVNPLYLRSLR